MKKAPPKFPPVVPLRALRQAHGLSARQLAERIAEHGVIVQPDSLLAVELGHTGASDELLVAWARALNLSRLDIRRADDLSEIFAPREVSA